MKKVVIVGVGIIAGLVMLVFLAYTGVVIYINWPGDHLLARNLRVSQEWIEITVSPPLSPRYRSQSIKLKLDNFSWDSNSNSFAIRLPDGSVITPEIEIYDEDGNKFELQHSGFSSKYYDAVVFRPPAKLPTDRKYTRLRIRSAVAFACDEISWCTKHMK
jgi:hypothetical protein